MPQIVEKGKGALTHKIGPLPLWGWVVAGAVAVFAVKKVGGRSSSGGFSGSIPIPSLSPGAGSSVGDGSIGTGGGAVGSPAHNAMGGSDTQPGGTAPWWTGSGWAFPNGSMNGIGDPVSDIWMGMGDRIPAVTLPEPPSTNGSRGSGSQTTPKDTAPVSSAPSWWTRLTQPQGALPAGAAVTQIGSTTYSLSDAALTRAQITGSSPIQPTSPQGATADVSPSPFKVNLDRYERV